MPKNCLIYETLNGVKDLNVKREGDLMTLSGCFGVCGVRNENKRVYEASNYSKMISEMKSRIKSEGGIPGELEHPQQMNITLENVSHKITDINIDENGVVTGSITLLNTPKGKIAQAIVEGGLPLFISSRATGNIDKSGNVCLERIATYDLVGTPGFSQAKLHLNENQVAESINESMYYITEKENGLELENNIETNNNDMSSEEILEKLSELEDRIQDLEEENQELKDTLNTTIKESQKKLVKVIAEGVENWVINEFAPEVENWITEHYSEDLEERVMESVKEDNKESQSKLVEAIADGVEKWVINEFAPEIENWIVEDYSPEIENWCKTEFADGIQKWITEEYSPEVENWLNESYSEKVKDIVEESKSSNLNSIDETLKLLESINVTKPKYQSKVNIVENSDEPRYVQEMPADKRPLWDMASNEVKESIHRRAKLYNFINEGSIEKFWENVNFNDIKPSKNIYEGLDVIENDREREIRSAFRRWRNR